ncbi:UNVERIFIED_ORG: hypothetical protein LHJ69_23610 [Shinella sp. XGS7]|nr:hypothetical protein [Shinella sp. XGS7]
MSLAAAFLPLSCWAAGPGWTGNATVEKLVVTADGGMNILLAPRLAACVPLSGYGPEFAWVAPSHPGFKSIKADLMLAYAMGKPVALYLINDKCQVVETMLGGW